MYRLARTQNMLRRSAQTMTMRSSAPRFVPVRSFFTATPVRSEIRPNKEQATGRELEELQGKWKEEVLDSHFGTKENPVLVPSHYSARVVGCVGGPGDKGHELLWHFVRKGKPTVCLECGQYFQLTDAGHGHDSHAHGSKGHGAPAHAH